MSDAVSALDGASFQGFARVTDLGPHGMITLRGDPGASKIKSAVKGFAGTGVPGLREIAIEGARAVAWMAPDELLLLCPYDEVADALGALQAALKSVHHLAVNVSDARAMIEVAGVDAREVIAKLSPADLSAAAFQPGQIRRTRLAQVPAAFWMPDENTFRIICFRSVAGYVFDILSNAAMPGSEVGFL